MQHAPLIERIRRKFDDLRENLDERARRRWAATEARALGWGGITAVAAATGLSDRTIRHGLRELDDPDPLPSDRQRRPGAGRKASEQTQPRLRDALDRLIEPLTRGSPTSPLRWTCKSTRRLARELCRQGFSVSASSVRRLLAAMGYSLQANRKTREGKQHPDRDGQFRHIHRRLLAAKRRGEPAISVDTKKKEVLGNLKNPGQTWEPQGKPRAVDTHDFPDPKLGKAIPYGVYDIHENEAWVSVGMTHDTAEFAVEAIRRWWRELGRPRYGRVGRVVVTADCGGSNSPKARLWKLELQRLADQTGMVIEVSHYPPGTSKWNRIEHRLFCHLTANWRGRPLETAEVVVESISHTTTESGLEVHACLDEKSYEKGRGV
jgi:transposase